MYNIAKLVFFSCTDFLPGAVLLIKKLKIDKNKPTFSYQYSKLYTRWPWLSQIPNFSLSKLLREGNQIYFTCNYTAFGNIRVICCTRSLFSISWKGDGRWSFWYVKKPNFRSILCFLKDKPRWPYSIQTARSICPFYTMKMPFLLPWLQNRLQTISSKKFSMLKKNLWDEIP